MTTMIGPLRRAVQVAPDAVAARCGDTEVTYAQTWDRARRLVGALRGLGMRDGDRVAVVGRNCHRYLELYQGVPGRRHGPGAAQPAPHRGRAGLRAAGLRRRVLFAAAGIDHPAGVVEHVIDLEDGYEALLAGRRARRPPGRAAAARPWPGLFYTGGTTGASKGVMLTHRNLVANAFHFQAQFAFRPDTCWLVAAPLFHAAGSIAVLATVWHGGRQVDAARVRSGRGAGPHRGRARDRDAGGADDAGGARRGAAGAAPGRLQPAAWSATGARRWPPRRCAAPTPRSPTPSSCTSTGPPRRRRSPRSCPTRRTCSTRPQARSCGQPAIGVEVGVLDVDRRRGRAGRGRRGASSAART